MKLLHSTVEFLLGYELFLPLWSIACHCCPSPGQESLGQAELGQLSGALMNQGDIGPWKMSRIKVSETYKVLERLESNSQINGIMFKETDLIKSEEGYCPIHGFLLWEI